MTAGDAASARNTALEPHAEAPAITATATSPATTLEDIVEASICEDTPAAKAAELHALHVRSAPLKISSSSVARGLDDVRRRDALEWLIQAFDALGFPDTELFSAFALLDRFAALSPAPITAGSGAFAVVLAAMLIVIKTSGTHRLLERAKRLVTEVSGSSKPWPEVRRAELCMLERLGYRVCTPTSRDLLDRLITEASQTTAELAQDGKTWDAGCHVTCANLARFLLELGLVHEPEALYGPGHPPLAQAIAALLLALLVRGAPWKCVEQLCDAARLREAGTQTVIHMVEAMRQRWCLEERRGSSGDSNSAVLEKWQRRVGGSLGASPPLAGGLDHFLLSGILPLAETTAVPAKAKAVGGVQRQPAAGRSSQCGNRGREARKSNISATEMIAALPTPARQRAGGMRGRNSEASVATSASAAVAVEQQRQHRQQQKQKQQQQHTLASKVSASNRLSQWQSVMACNGCLLTKGDS